MERTEEDKQKIIVYNSRDGITKQKISFWKQRAFKKYVVDLFFWLIYSIFW